ncbi:phospholipase C, phosphocholine-specific [Olivibacter sp. SDN3]|uniref:phosphocholine-specific phospholipase C n=1 Tax=Olivibacter sp. SDN3 TaxID=2764720 RepID=UPI001650FB3C|nr:phospholipase C, phosphocholine-specific [Olivibacter sp. SDN3]QNL51572.1 phospholipase C, phosphocholine-specific [Olivibacter sp. SDN3]
MDNRRDFIKKALLLAGTTGLTNTIPPVIQRALAIEPLPGSSFLDAEHIVILMQENRSFDHCFGTLKGVRGFNDPRFIKQANSYPVWFQSDNEGNTYAPFRLDLRGSKATWMGAVPHSRESQVDAYNNGWYNQWIEAKKKGKPYKDIPLTMGYHNREDVPFNYALADAFTVCDQNFCSGMTSTWPNRLFFWTGTIREEPNSESKAWIRNELQRGEAKWKTFPERLEEVNISWKAYQNDVSFGGGFQGEERSWLSSFSCNPLEFFEQYHIHFNTRHVKSLKKQSEQLPAEIDQLKTALTRLKPGDKNYQKTLQAIAKKEEVLEEVKSAMIQWSEAHFNKLPEKEKKLFRKAFTTNEGDPDYHSLDLLQYTDEQGRTQELTVPKGDLLYQFRKDVESGQLPAVSWMIPGEKYSDHPTAPWYGSWYVSEIMDILTKNPEVWRKTVFIMTYDENDGYFDHVPPFVPPNPYTEDSGKCSAGIDPTIEYITLEQELAQGRPAKQARGGAIGLGFRVPMIIASPWTRGGKVCSQVFDHTSTLQFLEKWVNQRFKTTIIEENISAWRRTVCGDLTAAFHTANEDNKDNLPFIERNPYLEGIHQAQFKEPPKTFIALTPEALKRASSIPHLLPEMPTQEEGLKVACSLPYELYADIQQEKDGLRLTLIASDAYFGDKSAGAPFTVYTPKAIRSYAVTAGDRLFDFFEMNGPAREYHIEVHGPNGFFRSFQNKGEAPELILQLTHKLKNNKPTGDITILVQNKAGKRLTVSAHDNAYGHPTVQKTVKAQEKASIELSLANSFCWYDLQVRVEGYPNFCWAYAGKVETGEPGYSDPQLGRITTMGKNNKG